MARTDTLFWIDGAISGLVLGPTVPAGHVWVVRGCQLSAGASGYRMMAGVYTGGIGYKIFDQHGVGSPEAVVNWYGWCSVAAGDQLMAYYASTGAAVMFSGYDIS